MIFIFIVIASRFMQNVRYILWLGLVLPSGQKPVICTVLEKIHQRFDTGKAVSFTGHRILNGNPPF